MSLMMGYCIGMIMLFVIFIACAIKGVYDMFKPYKPDPLYEDMRELVVNTEKEQGLE